MPKNARGFTLIELLITISIITLLATFGMNSFLGAQRRARDAERKSDLKNIQTSLRLYYNDKGFYPTNNATNKTLNACGTGAACATNCAWGSTWSCGATTYMQTLPGDPVGTDAYRYTRIDEDNYTLQACMENAADTQAIAESDNTWCATNRMFELRP